MERDGSCPHLKIESERRRGNGDERFFKRETKKTIVGVFISNLQISKLRKQSEPFKQVLPLYTLYRIGKVNKEAKQSYFSFLKRMYA